MQKKYLALRKSSIKMYNIAELRDLRGPGNRLV